MYIHILDLQVLYLLMKTISKFVRYICELMIPRQSDIKDLKAILGMGNSQLLNIILI